MVALYTCQVFYNILNLIRKNRGKGEGTKNFKVRGSNATVKWNWRVK